MKSISINKMERIPGTSVRGGLRRGGGRGGLRRRIPVEDFEIKEGDVSNVEGSGAIAGKVGGFGLGALLSAVPGIISGVTSIAKMVGKGRKRKHRSRSHSRRRHSSKRHRGEKEGGKFIPVGVDKTSTKIPKNLLDDRNMVYCLFKWNPKNAEMMSDEEHGVDPKHDMEMLKKLFEMNSNLINFVLLHEGDDEIAYKIPLEVVDSLKNTVKLLNFDMQIGAK